MRKNIILSVFLLLSGFLALVYGGEPQSGNPRVRGIHWQWCFKVPDQEFMLRSIPVMKELGYNAVIPEFGPYLYREGGVSREFFRRYLASCKDNGLEVIMLFNSLDHGERSPAWPARLANGFDLSEEKNYEYLFGLIDKVREDFAAVGLKMNYLHFGLDECEKVMAANVKKSGRKPVELMLSHVKRLNDFCRSRGCRMIMWHDMIMGAKGADPASHNEFNYSFSMRTDAWKCRADIPRDVIIMYWNYEPGTFKEPRELAKEGFEVWLMPWGDTNAASMLKQARKDGFKGLMLSTWMESGYYPGETLPHSNSIPCNDWMTAAIGTAVDRPVRQVVNGFFPIPENTGENIFAAASAEGRAVGTMLQGSNLKELVPPFYFVSGSNKEKIDGVNTGRGQNKLILYTPESGKGTKCNGFGLEITVAEGKVTARSIYGVGNSAIPANGFVLSGHDLGARKLKDLRKGVSVQVVDGKGRELTSRKVDNGDRISFEVGKSAAEVEFKWCLGAELPLDGKAVALLTIRYADGSEQKMEIKAGRDILAADSHKMFWGARESYRVWHAEDGFTGWRWRNPQPRLAVENVTLQLMHPENHGIRIKAVSVLK